MEEEFNWINLLIWVFVIIVILLIAVPNIIYQHNKLPHSHYRCKSNLRNLGRVITNYYTDNEGYYPQNLQELIRSNYLESLPTCFLTDEYYIYEINGWDDDNFTIWCPNPNEHVILNRPNNSAVFSYYYSSGVQHIDKKR